MQICLCNMAVEVVLFTPGSGVGTVAAIAAMATALFASFQRPKVIFTCRRLYYIITSRLTSCAKNAYNSLL